MNRLMTRELLLTGRRHLRLRRVHAEDFFNRCEFFEQGWQAETQAGSDIYLP